jgi:protoporphyrinogen oxidase
VSVLHIARLLRIIVLTRYYSCREGNAALHERLAERLDVRLETPVGRILMEGSRVTGVELVSGEAVKADHVIVCTPPPATAAMLPDDWIEELDFLRSVGIPTFAFPTLFLDRPLQPGIWSYMMPWRQGTLTSCVLDAHRKNPHMVPSGKAILQPWPAYPAWERLSAMDDDAITAAVLEELGRFWEGIEGWVEHVEVTRHAVAVPFHPAGHHAAAKAFMASADAREGVSFCGDYLSGGYVEPAVWTAERAVSRLGR